MSKENASQEFRLKNIDETRNSIEKVNYNELMNEKGCKVWNYIQHL